MEGKKKKKRDTTTDTRKAKGYLDAKFMQVQP